MQVGTNEDWDVTEPKSPKTSREVGTVSGQHCPHYPVRDTRRNTNQTGHLTPANRRFPRHGPKTDAPASPLLHERQATWVRIRRESVGLRNALRRGRFFTTWLRRRWITTRRRVRVEVNGSRSANEADDAEPRVNFGAVSEASKSKGDPARIHHSHCGAIFGLPPYTWMPLGYEVLPVLAFP